MSALSLPPAPGLVPKSRPGIWWLSFAYNMGRITTYTVLGALAGLLTLMFLPSPSFWTGLRLLSGIMLLLMGLYLAGWWRVLTRLETPGLLLWRQLQPIGHRLLPIHHLPGAYAAGLIWGFLPCGMVYSALTLGASSGSPVYAAASMFFFGLGTLPVLILGMAFSAQLQRWLMRLQIRPLAGSLLIIFGLWTLYSNFMPHTAHHPGMQSMPGMPDNSEG